MNEAAAVRPGGALARRAAGALSALVLAAAPVSGQEPAYPQTTFQPVSAYGASQNAVFMNTFWWTMGILVLVVLLTLYVAWRFRERPDSPEPAHVHGNVKLEIAWTLIPAVIVVLIAIPTVQTIFENQRRAPEGALQVEVIGHQWWWEFRYPEHGVVTANQMYIPVGRPIDLKMHSADVIHSFWIPRIGGKRDVNPQARAHEGESPSFNHIVFTADSAGYYPGQCAEYCGDSHAIMRMSVVAVAEPDFDAWVAAMQRGDAPAEAPVVAQPAAQLTVPTETGAAQAPPTQATPAQALAAGQEGVRGQEAQGPQPRPLPAPGQVRPPTGIGSAVQPGIPDSIYALQGRQVFGSSVCVACHAIQGTSAVGMVGPSLTRFGARPHVGAGAAENNLANLIRWIRDPQALKPGTLMPGAHKAGGGFPPTGLTDAEIHAIAMYLLSLR
ncbi:MAG TPA: cytochrome c oxidase subunit II [Longimicrobiales bacterium]|nr:cytochrome c oxidase subunit II [Longimicrobiales bacterium]